MWMSRCRCVRTGTGHRQTAIVVVVVGDGRTGAVGMREVGIGKRMVPQCARADAGAMADGDRGGVAALTSVVIIHAAENGGSQEPGAAPVCRWRVSQTADEYVAVCDGFEYGTERGIGRRYREAKCSERSDCRVGYGSPDTNFDHHKRVESPRVYVAKTIGLPRTIPLFAPICIESTTVQN